MTEHNAQHEARRRVVIVAQLYSMAQPLCVGFCVCFCFGVYCNHVCSRLPRLFPTLTQYVVDSTSGSGLTYVTAGVHLSTGALSWSFDLSPVHVGLRLRITGTASSHAMRRHTRQFS
jgi:hypothetical protein